MGDNVAMRVIQMSVNLNNEGEFNLPESFTGWATPIAVDVGGGHWPCGISVINNNKVKIWSGHSMGVNVTVIGYVSW